MIISPRGNKVALPHGGLPEIISPYMRELIQNTGGVNGPIGLQFVAQPVEEQTNKKDDKIFDPQEEYLHEVAPGMIYKYQGALDKKGNVIYSGRVLWTVSRFCATYCRFCFRGRMVGVPSKQPYLTDENIETCIAYIRSHKEINEVILSGGDPLVSSTEYLKKILSQLVIIKKEGSLDFIRIHTRAPITNPYLLRPEHYELFTSIPHLYIVLHINHPLELTKEVKEVIDKLQKAGVHLLSQSVLLKGVNDSVETLSELFTELVKIGVHPYYLHYNDPVYWAEHFTVPMDQAIKLWQQLRPRLSGIVDTAKFVIDTPFGHGKVSVPEAGWDINYGHFTDFKGKKNTIMV